MMKPSGPVFRDGSRYVRVTTEAMNRIGEREDIDRSLRLWFITGARINKDGHASMPPGMLAELLSIGGRLAQPSDISKAIRVAKERQLIGLDSNSRCLTVSHQDISQGYGYRGCGVHRIQHLDDKNRVVD